MSSSKLQLSPTPIDPSRIVFVEKLPLLHEGLDNATLHFLHVLFSGNPTARAGLPEPKNDDEKIRPNLFDRSQQQEIEKAPSYSSPKILLTQAPNTSKIAYTKSIKTRFRALKSGQWFEIYNELVAYKQAHGDCIIPTIRPEYAVLVLWIKRQRQQYRLRQDGKHSNLTDERKQALEEVGFVWSPNGARWDDRFEELRAFEEVHGHCNVPKNCADNHQLAAWVRCQRRRCKLALKGAPTSTTLTPERINKLTRLGFR